MSQVNMEWIIKPFKDQDLPLRASFKVEECLKKEAFIKKLSGIPKGFILIDSDLPKKKEFRLSVLLR